MYVEKRLLSRTDNDNSKRNGDPDWPASQKIPGIKRERRTIIGRGWRFVDEKLAVKWFSWIGRVDSALNRFCLSIDNLTASNYGPWHVSMQFARFCNRSLDLWSFEWTKKDYKEVPRCFTRSMMTRLMLFVFVKLKIVDVIWSTSFTVNISTRKVFEKQWFLTSCDEEIWIITVWMRNIWKFYYREN